MPDIERYVNTDSTAGGDGTTNATAGANRAYASLSEWNADEATDLVTATDTHTVRCDGGLDNVAVVNLSGWTTNATYDLTIVSDNLHNGTRGSGYRVVVNDDYARIITVNTANVTIDGLEISNTATNQADGISQETGSLYLIVKNCLLYDCGRDNLRLDSGTSNATASVINCIVYGSGEVGINCRNSGLGGGNSIEVYNATVMNSGTYGISQNDWRYSAVKNCYVGVSGTADYYESANGNQTITTSHSSDGTRSTTTTAMSTSSGAYFTNVTATSEDCKITSSSSALDGTGTDLSGDSDFPFDYDFEGTSRPATDWDVGAFQFVGAGGSTMAAIYQRTLMGVS